MVEPGLNISLSNLTSTTMVAKFGERVVQHLPEHIQKLILN